MHIEFLIEEESAAVALSLLVPKIVGLDVTFATHAFQGKLDLLKKLPERLRGYRAWLPKDWRIVVLVDRDDDDCLELTQRLEAAAMEAGLMTRSAQANAPSAGGFQVLNRVAVEELEAWFFGDVQALAAAFPRVSANLARKRQFRNPDAIAGGTWESLERVLQNAGYYPAGMPKMEVARTIAEQMAPERNRSRSFGVFCEGLRALTT